MNTIHRDRLASKRCSASTQCQIFAAAYRRRRCFRRFAALVCVLVIAAVIGGLPVYVRPQVDPLRHADAILILGGEGDSRYLVGLDLGLKGWAPTVLASNPMAPEDPSLADYCTARHRGLDLRCFVPDPGTTKGEGRDLRRLAAQHGWRTVIVVTFRPHISRARFVLEQCFDGDLVMVASPAQISFVRWIFEYIYQTAGYLRAALQPGC